MLSSMLRRVDRVLLPWVVARQLSTPPVGGIHEVPHPDMQKEFRGREDNFPCLAR